MVDELRIGVLGFGTVGAGTVRLLLEHEALLQGRTGVRLRLVRVVDRVFPAHEGIPLERVELVDDPQRVVAADDIDVVVELFGGIETPKRLIAEALSNGKHVVTANKALIAEHGNALLALAAERQRELLFEAAVAGAIPVIRTVKEGLAANRIQRVYGILNGTCNYILTEMREKGRPFDQVLAEAQAKGYAEADPTLDVDGYDAAHKLAILAAIAFGTPLAYDQMSIEGIRQVSEVDIAWANQMGYRVKLLAVAKRSADGVELRVQPALVPARSMVGAVDGVFNAVFVQADYAGSTMYYGRGAGERPTASSVVADLMEIARNLRAGAEARVALLSTLPENLRSLPVVDASRLRGEYYLRLLVEDRPGVLADITAILRDQQVSIATVRQEARSPQEAVPLVLTTHETSEDRIHASLERIRALEAVKEKPHLMRIEHLPD